MALMPLYAHGDTEDSPKPVPSITRISDKAAIAAAPAKIALHETALACIGEVSEEPLGLACPDLSIVVMVGAAIMNSQLIVNMVIIGQGIGTRLFGNTLNTLGIINRFDATPCTAPQVILRVAIRYACN